MALAYAQHHGRHLDAVWTLDSPPGKGVTASGRHFMDSLLTQLREIPMPIPSRQLVVSQLIDHGFGKAVGYWMTTNLRRIDEGFEWRFQLPVIEALLNDYWQCDFWQFLEDPERRPEVHVMLAGKTDWWKGATLERFEANPRVHVHHLPTAGHWVHIDDPDGMLAALSTSLI